MSYSVDFAQLYPIVALVCATFERLRVTYRKCARGLPTHPEGTRRQVNGAWLSLWYANKRLTIRS
jgi:hypothetical protein